MMQSKINNLQENIESKLYKNHSTHLQIISSPKSQISSRLLKTSQFPLFHIAVDDMLPRPLEQHLEDPIVIEFLERIQNSKTNVYHENQNNIPFKNYITIKMNDAIIEENIIIDDPNKLKSDQILKFNIIQNQYINNYDNPLNNFNQLINKNNSFVNHNHNEDHYNEKSKFYISENKINNYNTNFSVEFEQNLSNENESLKSTNDLAILQIIAPKTVNNNTLSDSKKNQNFSDNRPLILPSSNLPNSMKKIPEPAEDESEIITEEPAISKLKEIVEKRLNRKMSFNILPTDEKEDEDFDNIKKIIERMRYHQKPIESKKSIIITNKIQAPVKNKAVERFIDNMRLLILQDEKKKKMSESSDMTPTPTPSIEDNEMRLLILNSESSSLSNTPEIFDKSKKYSNDESNKIYSNLLDNNCLINNNLPPNLIEKCAIISQDKSPKKRNINLDEIKIEKSKEIVLYETIRYSNNELCSLVIQTKTKLENKNKNIKKNINQNKFVKNINGVNEIKNTSKSQNSNLYNGKYGTKTKTKQATVHPFNRNNVLDNKNQNNNINEINTTRIENIIYEEKIKPVKHAKKIVKDIKEIENNLIIETDYQKSIKNTNNPKTTNIKINTYSMNISNKEFNNVSSRIHNNQNVNKVYNKTLNNINSNIKNNTNFKKSKTFDSKKEFDKQQHKVLEPKCMACHLKKANSSNDQNPPIKDAKSFKNTKLFTNIDKKYLKKSQEQLKRDLEVNNGPFIQRDSNLKHNVKNFSKSTDFNYQKMHYTYENPIAIFRTKSIEAIYNINVPLYTISCSDNNINTWTDTHKVGSSKNTCTLIHKASSNTLPLTYKTKSIFENEISDLKHIPSQYPNDNQKIKWNYLEKKKCSCKKNIKTRYPRCQTQSDIMSKSINSDFEIRSMSEPRFHKFVAPRRISNNLLIEDINLNQNITNELIIDKKDESSALNSKTRTNSECFQPLIERYKIYNLYLPQKKLHCKICGNEGTSLGI